MRIDPLRNKKDWKLVGHFGVDAGLCWIGDPCYILHGEHGLPSSLGKNWLDFCELLWSSSQKNATSFGYETGGEGLGICVSTGYGDGTYPVYILEEEGRCAAVFIDFFGLIEDQEDE